MTSLNNSQPAVNNQSHSQSQKIRCPYCGEEIMAVAKKCRHCGEWLESVAPEAPIMPQPTYQQPTYQRPIYQQPIYQQPLLQQAVSTKSKGVAAVLAILLGEWGIHEFYLGNTGTGVAYLLIWFIFCWTIIVPILLAIVSVIQGISYLCMSDEAFAAKYH